MDGEINKMKTDFQAYQLDMAAKKKALHPSGPPPPSVAMPSANNGHAIIQHLQNVAKEEQSLQIITVKNQVQSAMEELLAEIKVRVWKEAEDDQVQDAMRKVSDWESRRLKVGSNFQEYKSLMTKCCHSQLTDPGSEYSNLKSEVEEFNSDFSEGIGWIKDQDRDRNLGTLEKTPTSLMD